MSQRVMCRSFVFLWGAVLVLGGVAAPAARGGEFKLPSPRELLAVGLDDAFPTQVPEGSLFPIDEGKALSSVDPKVRSVGNLSVGGKVIVPVSGSVSVRSTDYHRRLVSCNIDVGSQLKILGFTANKQLAAVFYDGWRTCRGTLYMRVDALKTFNARSAKILRERKARQKTLHDDIQAILIGTSKVSSVGALMVGQLRKVAKTRWVNQVNPSAPVNARNEGYDSCLIEKGGQATLLGFTSDRKRALYEYHGRGGGTACHYGTLFLLGGDPYLETE